ncbi:MAG: hypothetical protein M1826_006123 [Phylliscum demangeonii]|nr:MAG: hypothetical protein M1826_006123 [Phylliscum demangeonii]
MADACRGHALDHDVEKDAAVSRQRLHAGREPADSWSAAHDGTRRHEPEPVRRPGSRSTAAVALAGRTAGSFRMRIKHFTWTWFTMAMATGGIANVIYNVPFRFGGLYAVGCVFFVLNVVIFVADVVLIGCRFACYPFAFRQSFLHPTESLFIPASIVACGTVLLNISQYGMGRAGPWLDATLVVLFYVDCALAVVASVAIYLILWSTTTFTVANMTPVWIFPAYPLLIAGPYAAVLSARLGAHASAHQALAIILTGFVLQGIGFMVSLMIYSAYIYRLMTHKLPQEALRPAMFVSVGPSGFTITALIGLGASLDRVLSSSSSSSSSPSSSSSSFMGVAPALAGTILKLLANAAALWLWGLALWFFLISVFAHSSCIRPGRLHFSLTWYSFVFPNTALAAATFAVARTLADVLPSAARALQRLGAVMAVALVVAWALVVAMTLRALYLRQILWPQEDEDRDEGGFKGREG